MMIIYALPLQIRPLSTIMTLKGLFLGLCLLNVFVAEAVPLLSKQVYRAAKKYDAALIEASNIWSNIAKVANQHRSVSSGRECVEIRGGRCTKWIDVGFWFSRRRR